MQLTTEQTEALAKARAFLRQQSDNGGNTEHLEALAVLAEVLAVVTTPEA